jgi:hypothetical protein
MTRDEFQREIDAELSRIGADDNGLGPCSSVCAEVGPNGFVRYWDDAVSCVARTEEFLAALRDLPDRYCQEPQFCDNTDFWESFPVAR